MTPFDDPFKCADPLVRQIMMQGYAIDLIRRGLLPKQICIITGLPGKKVKELRTGLLPVNERRGRPTKSAATMLRKAPYRVVASMFISIYRGLCGADPEDGENWPFFLKSYDIYLALTEGLSADLPTVQIEDAFTLVFSLNKGILTVKTCSHHGVRYLALTSQERGWRCPYCTLEDGNEKAQPAVETGELGETEPYLGLRAANISDLNPDTMRE